MSVLDDSSRNILASLVGEDRCLDEFAESTYQHTEVHVCREQADHVHQHECRCGFRWPHPDEPSDALEPDTVKEWRGEA